MSLHIYEDIHTPDLEKKQDFFKAWNSGQYSDAYAQLQNTTFDHKKLEATALNNICDAVTDLQYNTDSGGEEDVIQVAFEPPADLEVGQVYFQVRSGAIDNVMDDMVGLSTTTNNLFTGNTVASALKELNNKDKTLQDSITALQNTVDNLPSGGGGGTTTAPTDDSKVNLSSTTSSLFTGSTVASALSELKSSDNSISNRIDTLSSSIDSVESSITSVNASIKAINASIQITSGTLPVARGGTGVTSMTSLANDIVKSGYVYRIVSRTGTGTTTWSISVGFTPSAFICITDSVGTSSCMSWWSSYNSDWLYISGGSPISATNKTTNEVTAGTSTTKFSSTADYGLLNSTLTKYTYIFFR